MSIFDINFNTQGKLLLPPKKRLTKWLAWIYTLLKPVQWLRDWFFGVYIDSANYTLFSNSGTTYYVLGDRVVWYDNSLYECLNPTLTLATVSSPILMPDMWYKLQDCFIGVDERTAYNSQIIVLERALNRWFHNIGAVKQIYIVVNQTNGDKALLANTSLYSMTMSRQSFASVVYMGNTYAPGTQYDYTIMIPAALYATLGPTLTDQENAVRNIADKYNMAGMRYLVFNYI